MVLKGVRICLWSCTWGRLRFSIEKSFMEDSGRERILTYRHLHLKKLKWMSLTLKVAWKPCLSILTVCSLILDQSDLCTNIILCRKMLFLAEVLSLYLVSGFFLFCFFYFCSSSLGFIASHDQEWVRAAVFLIVVFCIIWDPWWGWVSLSLGLKKTS